jgi:uncharacterized protein YjbI with pentapeptide repeats
MIEIRHRESGNVLLRLPVDTLVGRNFKGKRLADADFANMLLSSTDFSHANLTTVDFHDAMLEEALSCNAVLTGVNL